MAMAATRSQPALGDVLRSRRSGRREPHRETPQRSRPVNAKGRMGRRRAFWLRRGAPARRMNLAPVHVEARARGDLRDRR